MGKKTLYVSDNDEAIWKAAQGSAAGSWSLSGIVTEALAEYIASRNEASQDGLDADAEHRVADRALVRVMRSLIRRHGVNDVSWAFGRALVDEGASRSRAAAIAQTTLGRDGREAAARKASATKGIEGHQSAAAKAWATKKAKAKLTI